MLPKSQLRRREEEIEDTGRQKKVKGGDKKEGNKDVEEVLNKKGSA